MTNAIGLGDRAPDFTLKNQDSEPRRLADLCREHPLAIFFERHIGWPFCHEHVVDVRRDYSRFQEAGGDVIVITMGSVEQTRALRDRHQLPFDCLSDPEKTAYSAFQAPRGGFWNIAGPRVWLAGIKAIARGGIAMPGEDVKQLQSSFIVDRSQIIRFVHRPDSSAEHPDHEVMLEVFKSLRE